MKFEIDNVKAFYQQASGGLFPQLLANVKDFRDFVRNPTKGKQDIYIQQEAKGVPAIAQFECIFKGKNFQFSYPPLITISGSQTVLKTMMAGYSGSVKEVVSLNDYKINIKGLALEKELYSESAGTDFDFKIYKGVYPEREIRKIREICESGKSLQIVNSPYLSLFGIEYLMIENFNFIDFDGMEGVAPFTIDAYSDKPIVLTKTRI